MTITLLPPPLSLIIPEVLGLIYDGTLAADDIAVFDSSYNQAFPQARPIKVNVTTASKLMDHPIEDGSIITDFRVILPTALELSVVCSGDDFADVFQQIKNAYLSEDVFTVTTRVDTYTNMVIAAYPHDETPEMFDGVLIAVKFREAILVQSQYQPLPAQQVSNPNDQSTVNTGSTTPQTPNGSQSGSALSSMFPNFLK